jgi:hypothetical protein
MNLYGRSVGILGRGIGPTQGFYVHASSEIRTHDPRVLVVEDSMCLRQRGHTATHDYTKYRSQYVFHLSDIPGVDLFESDGVTTLWQLEATKH